MVELPEHYGTFVLVSLALAITPGPDILYVLGRGLAQGPRSALAAALGFSLGNIVHTLVVAFGIAAALTSGPQIFGVIRYVGALYLVYLGVRMMKRAHGTSVGTLPPESLWTVFRQSVMANLLNPKVVLFFLGLFPQFVDPARGAAFGQTVLLGATFIACTLVVFSAVALLAGKLNQTFATRPDRQKALQQFGGVVLLGIAVWLVWPSSP